MIWDLTKWFKGLSSKETVYLIRIDSKQIGILFSDMEIVLNDDGTYILTDPK